MAENSAEPTEPGHEPGSNTDTRQPSVQSLKGAILESLSWFSDYLVSVLNTKLTQIHEQVAVKFTDHEMNEEDEDTAREPPAKRASSMETGVPNMPATSCLGDRDSGGVSPEPEEDRVSIYADEEGL